ncbi:MAG: hypothetical protein IJF90_09435 [Synergistaceae bacterium]|nr:hypothetical protein [Synergistaceae bacterium]MBQ4400534.1 hypothetical protein [Synergistaceae bacterium]MBQ6114666.1 hypothetical protein [Synergistaceae bacterium]MBQ6981596.1 hypothetical protein [Synergistaceae bacterium]
MLNLASNVAWQEILHETEAGNIPHCRAISVPVSVHAEIIETLSRLILGSYRPSHPDLLIIGTADKAPSIGEYGKPNYEYSCRWLIENIAMRPMESKRRLAVIECADKLNKSAGNSLLKLAEEPPEHAYLLFLMEDGRLFLPTLKSRSRFTAITSNEYAGAQRMPLDSREWTEWLTKARKSTNDNDTITPDLEAWGSYALETGNIELAERIEKLRIISTRKNLSVPMLCDIIILALKEGIEIDVN